MNRSSKYLIAAGAGAAILVAGVKWAIAKIADRL